MGVDHNGNAMAVHVMQPKLSHKLKRLFEAACLDDSIAGMINIMIVMTGLTEIGLDMFDIFALKELEEFGEIHLGTAGIKDLRKVAYHS